MNNTELHHQLMDLHHKLEEISVDLIMDYAHCENLPPNKKYTLKGEYALIRSLGIMLLARMEAIEATDNKSTCHFHFEEALTMLKEGAAMRRESWGNNEFIAATDDNGLSKRRLKHIQLSKHDSIDYFPTAEDMFANDWMLAV